MAQARTINEKEAKRLFAFVGTQRNPIRNKAMLALSYYCGLRAKEIASLTWSMVLNADGTIASDIRLTDKASKGRSGRVIPMNTDVAGNLTAMLSVASGTKAFTPSDRVITSERSDAVSSQMVVNSFRCWYRELGLEGCSSHSGRRTFITNTARLISTCGGSLRDVQMMAGHASLQMTQTYIEGDSQSRSKVVNLL